MTTFRNSPNIQQCKQTEQASLKTCPRQHQDKQSDMFQAAQILNTTRMLATYSYPRFSPEMVHIRIWQRNQKRKTN